METKLGSCLCGGVSFEVSGELRSVVACHCGQCRKTSGHFWAATQVDESQFKLRADGPLKWFSSSAEAVRGFCGQCGSSLFWRKHGEGKLSIAAGAFDETGLQVAKHIYCKDKGDYYEIEPGVPQL